MATKASGVRFSVVLGAGLLACSLAAAQQVTIARDSKLHAEPSASAAVVGQLRQGASAEVTGKQGAFVQVTSAEGTGWVFSFNVSYAGGAPAAAAPTPQRRGTTATIGIRGLDKEDLKNATFDAKQLDALDGFAAGAGAAEEGSKASPRRKK